MAFNKAFALPGYLVAFLLFANPLFDGLTNIWPPQPGSERWRFGAIGSLSNLLLLPALGLLIALALSIIYDHRIFRRVLGWVCAVSAVLLAAVLVIFILDFFQIRALVRPQVKSVMTIASTAACAKLFLGILFLVLLSRAGLSGLKGGMRKPIAPPESSPTTLVTLPGTARPG